MTAVLDSLRARCAAALPHPDAALMHALGEQTLTWVIRHLDTLPRQPLGRPASRRDLEALLSRPPSEEGRTLTAVLDEFERVVSTHAVRTNHPRFLAFVPGAPSYLSVLGELLCAGTNFFAGVWLEAAGPAQVELVVLDWFKHFLGCPAEARGVLTGGGSEANLTALVVAREQHPVADRGRLRLYVTEQRHWSIDRAAMVIGILPDQIRPVPADEHYRLSLPALRARVTQDRRAGLVPWVVVANAGATNTGAVDPLPELADFCQRERLWFHVDAAYGWAAVLSTEGAHQLAGIGRADSLTLDPHKWFAQTFDAGCVLIRQGELLPRTFAMRPEYMQDVEPGTDEVNFADHGIALTRRFRALKIWLSVEVLGLRWFRALVEHCLALAELGQALLLASGRFEILAPPQLSIVCFRYLPAGPPRQEKELNDLNLALIDAVRATGRAFLSSTRLRERVAIRFCFVNWRTTTADVEEVICTLLEEGARLSAPGPAGENR